MKNLDNFPAALHCFFTTEKHVFSTTDEHGIISTTDGVFLPRMNTD
ncbi:MAG: hypothetical protein IJ928_04195 [Prevotella sp.]|nr:hypothetical protein [Prevotella sp.]